MSKTGWIILRTAGQSTLPLASSLTAAGIDAWSPVQMVKRRTMRGKKATEERPAPMMATFVFARAEHLPELHRICALPSSPHAGFSLFRYQGRVPVIADREVERLRMAERRVAPKGQRRVFAAGQTVRTTEGGFAGLDGVVEDTRGKFTVVCFGGTMRVQISTFLLTCDDVGHGQPISGIAA